MDKKLIIIAVISILVGILIGVYFLSRPESSATTDINKENIIAEDETINDIELLPEVIAPQIKEKVIRDDIKAIYLTGWSAGTKSKLESTITNIKENGFNAVVIDIKDEAGRLSYKSNVQTAIDIGASQNMISDINNVINLLKENNIYVIGRIVTFKDPLYAKKVQDIAYKKVDNSIWTDYSGNNWPNPYNISSWDYPIALAKEGAELGFDEIQFDYVRFPSSEGRTKQIAFGFDSDTKTKSQVINSFLEKVMFELEEYKIVVSADVFGIITKRQGDFENIGQDFAAIGQIVDVICPMVYPSHYASGEYKLANPDKSPYNTVYYSVNDGLKRYEEIENLDAKKAVIRPYLQDFTASWLGRGKYLNYSTNQVKEQIQACYDLRINSFTLWDPSNKYCYDALPQCIWMSEEEYQAKLEQEKSQAPSEEVIVNVE
ncbi:MAG: putative glycoside hydrolase [Clostridia bacterium]|nr:putative glycoside hydrolase [Clostridia bacterium]